MCPKKNLKNFISKGLLFMANGITRYYPHPEVVQLIFGQLLRKSVKSLQCIVNESMDGIGLDTVSASAYSQARYKLKHTAFIELNQKAIVDVLYQDGNYKKYWGMRVLAVDGSKIRLPNTEDICDAFGTIAYSQGEGSEVQGKHPYALASVLHDVLNRISIDAVSVSYTHLTLPTNKEV